MNRKLSRREFLKLLTGMPMGMYLSHFAQPSNRLIQNPDAKNVLIIVFDAWSAKNISLYGYQRNTMPNLARIAEKATVYHHHYAGGNFTTPGAATLLTGTYPWTHGAMRVSSTVASDKRRNNIFNRFDQYYRVAFSHNPIANIHLQYFMDDIDYLKPQSELLLKNKLAFDRFFPYDFDTASIAQQRIVKDSETEYSYSLFFSNLYEEYTRGAIQNLSELFPRGLPKSGGNYFLLEESVDWVKSQLDDAPQPFLGYFHFLPPHHPYSPRREFVNAFREDGVGYLIDKPKSIFSSLQGKVNLQIQSRERQEYDEFLLYADAELGRLYDYLRESPLMENTWIVITSDHGEMFERGIYQHNTPVLYDPVIRIPLLILAPGQQARQDIHTTTSAADILPTLLKVTGHEIPDWVEGKVLPPFSDTAASVDRSIFAVEARSTREVKTLSPVTTVMVKRKHKLMYFSGYEELGDADPQFELYDLENDPEELRNLYNTQSNLSQEFRDELIEALRTAERSS